MMFRMSTPIHWIVGMARDGGRYLFDDILARHMNLLELYIPDIHIVIDISTMAIFEYY